MMNVKEVKVFGKEVSVQTMGEYAFDTYIEDGICQEEELERLVNHIVTDVCERYDDEEPIEAEDVWVEFVAQVYDSDIDEYHTIVFDEKGNFKYEI